MKITSALRGIALFLFVVVLFTSCEKEEGEGGTGTIEGRVYALNYNSDFSIKLGEYYAPDVDVFIIYGNDSIHSDKTETSYNGWYRFQYLNKGTYTLYVLSNDPERISASGKIVIQQTINISDNNSTVIADDLVIYE
ncbi:hypothetical protein [Mangrovibacterium diazotrophicum]|uniref:Carboxypeptidase family protein n=1 Tax=Mangrovibacterium diazotrophicum TaxID=1261403 RepID=A0A419W5J8_9BACT|nr:hypothetical protein [Mangrovibacterium diazotrophicum]RKD90733.1 hypothetical protein BC643_1076 [Mangrovibacterium diazotrophicum]